MAFDDTCPGASKDHILLESNTVRLDHCASVVHICLGMFGLAEMRVQSSVLSQRHSGQRGGGLGLARHDGVKLEDQSGSSICHTPGAPDTSRAPSLAVVFVPCNGKVRSYKTTYIW